MFSKATEYALRATLFIAQRSNENKRVGIDEIAKEIGSPRSFTAKIMQDLTRNNSLVSSVRGPNGGFYLTDNARKMPMRIILDIMGENEVLKKCVLGLYACSEVKPCPMHHQYKHIKQQLIELFSERSIQDVADEIGKGEVIIKNFIPSRKKIKK